MSQERTESWRAKVYAGGGAVGKKARPSVEVQRKLLREQKNRCFYCGNPFGGVVTRNRKKVATRVVWDHFVPFSFLDRNPVDNWLAACQICNGIKGSRMFKTKEDAREYVKAKAVVARYR